MSELEQLLALSVRASRLKVRVRTLQPRDGWWNAYRAAGRPDEIGVGFSEPAAIKHLLDRVEALSLEPPAHFNSIDVDPPL